MIRPFPVLVAPIAQEEEIQINVVYQSFYVKRGTKLLIE